MPTRPAREEDVTTLVSMMRRFAAETSLPLTYDEDRAWETFMLALRAEDAILIVWESGGVLGGLAFGTLGYELSAERCAYIHKLYVECEFRGLGVGEELLQAFDQKAETKSAKLFFSSATAGMGEDIEQAYVRLFERKGYTTLGRVVVRSVER